MQTSKIAALCVSGVVLCGLSFVFIYKSTLPTRHSPQWITEARMNKILMSYEMSLKKGDVLGEGEGILVSLAAIYSLSENDLVDAWGGPFVVEFKEGVASLVSHGPDGVFSTDDIVREM